MEKPPRCRYTPWQVVALRWVALASCIQAVAAWAGVSKPNIVFILADDLGYADVACYGHPDIQTPHIDQLAANGVRFLQAYASSAVCSATRAALITGRYQYRLRVGLEEPLTPAYAGVGLDPEHATLPSLLKRAGYRSALVGKWHLGVLPKYGPLQSGYDQFYGFRGGALDYFSHRGGGGHDLWENDQPVHEAGYLTRLLGDRAVAVVNGYAKSREPFLLSLHFSAPHWPWEGHDDEAESKRLAQAGGKGGLFHYDGGSQKTYRQMVEAMDHEIGRVLQALETNGLSDNTLIVFTSDNGGERFSNTWPFSGKKTELLEGGLRVPAILSWPGRIARGRTTEQVAISMDWLPTLLAAAGTAPDAAYPPDGMNLLSAVGDEATVTRRTLFWRYKANQQRAVRDGDLKLLKIREDSYLFNVVDDPLERANVKDRQQPEYQRLVREWSRWNATMLPEIKESFTGGSEGKYLAEHYGRTKVDGEPDIPEPPKD